MNSLFKTKYKMHRLVNLIFYLIIFSIGFFVGLQKENIKKVINNLFIENVYAYDTIDYEFTIDSFNYNLFDITNYDYESLFNKVDLVIDYFHQNYDQEQFGITVIISPTFTNSDRNVLNTSFSSGSSYNSKIMFHFYDKNEISLSTDADLDNYNRFRVLKYSATGFYSGNFTRLYTSDSPIWTYSLEDFETYVSDGNLESLFTWTTEPNISSTVSINQIIDLRPGNINVSTDTYSRDIIYYYSDADIKFNYILNKVKFNNSLLLNEDIIPTFYDYLNSSPGYCDEPDYSWLLDNYTKYCTNYAVAVGATTDYQDNIYFLDSDVSNVDVNFDFYEMNNNTNFRTKYNGLYYSMEDYENLVFTDYNKIGIYELPVKVDISNNIFTIIDISDFYNSLEMFGRPEYCFYYRTDSNIRVSLIHKDFNNNYTGHVVVGSNVFDINDLTNSFDEIVDVNSAIDSISDFIIYLGNGIAYFNSCIFNFFNLLPVQIKRFGITCFIVGLIFLVLRLGGFNK